MPRQRADDPHAPPLFTADVSLQNAGTTDRAGTIGELFMYCQNSRLRVAIAIVATALSALFAAGCAPDDMVNRQATGFDAFTSQIASKCNPLVLGSHNVGQELLYSHGIGDDSYDYFLDITSRLYYGQISAASYRGAVLSFFGAGDDTSRGIDCIIGNLPSTPPPVPDGPAKRINNL
jgi:hypothetical protein